MDRHEMRNDASREGVTGSNEEHNDESPRCYRRGREDKEGERDKEAEEERSLRSRAAAAADDIRIAFSFLEFQTHGEPFGPLAFQLEWADTVKNFHPAEDGDYQNCFVVLMERCIRDCNAKGIKVPGPFFEEKRFEEFYKW